MHAQEPLAWSVACRRRLCLLLVFSSGTILLCCLESPPHLARPAVRCCPALREQHPQHGVTCGAAGERRRDAPSPSSLAEAPRHPLPAGKQGLHSIDCKHQPYGIRIEVQLPVLMDCCCSRAAAPMLLPPQLPDYNPATTVVLFPDGPQADVVGQCAPVERVVVLGEPARPPCRQSCSCSLHRECCRHARPESNSAARAAGNSLRPGWRAPFAATLQ